MQAVVTIGSGSLPFDCIAVALDVSLRPTHRRAYQQNVTLGMSDGRQPSVKSNLTESLTVPAL